MEITSQTKLTCIIGNPVEHSLSPIIQNAAFESAGINWAYVALPVIEEKLSAAISTIKTFFKGANITMPYKQDVIPFMDEVSSFAKMVSAVNTIKVEDDKLIGFNTDGRGFLTALEEELKFLPDGKSVVIIGAGGAARSIATILALSKAKSITIINRSVEKAKHLGESIISKFEDVNIDVLSLEDNLPKSIEKCDLLINATPVGMDGKTTPVDTGVISKGQYVADLIYQPAETKLIKDAKKTGAKTMTGRSMLIYQGAESFEVWTDHNASIKDMKKAFDEAMKK